MRNGIIFYKGPSQFDGEPIVGIATGLIRPSTNTKTGPVVQTYCLRAHQHPIQAVHTGEDVSICGSCRHRGRVEVGEDGRSRNRDRSCYVQLFRGPHVVYRAYAQGLYDEMSPHFARRALTRRHVRLGAYGDIAAIPFEVVDTIVGKAWSVTGFTHGWREYPEFSKYCMASVESEEEREAAHALGFRTFRTRSEDDPALEGEGICPASAEMGRATRCLECGICGGRQGRGEGDIVIKAHGSGARHFKGQSRALIAA